MGGWNLEMGGWNLYMSSDTILSIYYRTGSVISGGWTNTDYINVLFLFGEELNNYGYAVNEGSVMFLYKE